MNAPDRILSILSICVCAGLWSCGKEDRLSNGTSGTQTGNALQARLLLSNGTPAVNARVSARPAQASDSSDPVRETMTDSVGKFELRLVDGDWTLEATIGRTAVRKDLHLSSDTVLPPDTLVPCGELWGKVEGLQPGQSLSILGLGRRVVPDASGRFRFAALPRGTHPLRLLGSAASWSVVVASARTDTLLLDANRSGEIFAAMGDSTTPVSRNRPVLLVQTWFPSFTGSLASLEWIDAQGNVLPSLPLDMATNSGTFRAWVRPPASGAIRCRRVVSGQARRSSPFSDDRLALVFPATTGLADSMGTDSVLNYADSTIFAGFASSSAFGNLPAEGWFRRSPLGSPLAWLSGSNLPTKPGWSIAVRASLEYPDIGRIWLLDWSNPATGDGLKVGIGAGVLEIVGPGLDTTLSVSALGEFHDWSVSSDGSTISVGVDGRKLTTVAMSAPGTGWSRCGIGIGGGIRLSRLFVADRPLAY